MRCPRRPIVIVIVIVCYGVGSLGSGGCSESLTVAEERDASRPSLQPEGKFSDGAPPPSDSGADASDADELHDPPAAASDVVDGGA